MLYKVLVIVFCAIMSLELALLTHIVHEKKTTVVVNPTKVVITRVITVEKTIKVHEKKGKKVGKKISKCCPCPVKCRK